MAYLLRYNGTGGVTAPTLGNLIAGAPKVKIVIKKFRFAAGNAAIFWQGGAAFALRELVFRRSGTNWEIYCGNTSTLIATSILTTAFGNAELACDEFTFELEGTACRLYKDGVVVHTATIGRSTGRLNNALLYIGCQPVNDTAGNTAISTPAPNGSEYGDISIYINDVLTRQYVMPGTGSTIPDTANGQTASQNGTWPVDDSEWVFYSGGTYTLDALGGSYSYSGVEASIFYDRLIDSIGADFSYSGNSTELLLGKLLTVTGASYSYSGAPANIEYTSVGSYVMAAIGGSFVYSGASSSLVFFTPSARNNQTPLEAKQQLIEQRRLSNRLRDEHIPENVTPGSVKLYNESLRKKQAVINAARLTNRIRG